MIATASRKYVTWFPCRSVTSITMRVSARSECRPLLYGVLTTLLLAGSSYAATPRLNAAVVVSGELKEWHKVTLTMEGPQAAETDNDPNPFTDYNFTVTFTHESGAPSYRVPGYFAADGHAGETAATAGNQWRAHLAPDRAGRWDYLVAFTQGRNAALDGGGVPVAPLAGAKGSFIIAATDKTGRDFRGRGRLDYVGTHQLQFAGSKEYFLKAGVDSPETLLAYADFDNTIAPRKTVPLKTWAAHVRDWRTGDPTWQGGKGKGLIGALNYLAAKGMNSFSFLTYNAGGDGDNVWPFVRRDDKRHYDCSKLDQWGMIFDHATAQGLYLSFKLQEQENDDNRVVRPMPPGSGPRAPIDVGAVVPESFDGGATGPERKLYLRELIARFGHELALNWNLSEESTQSTAEQQAMAQFIADTDPYHHLIVVHTFIPRQDAIYTPLLGDKSKLTGASLQSHWDETHERTLTWVTKSAAAGKPWIVASDEQGSAAEGVPPDPGFEGYNGTRRDGVGVQHDLNDIRKLTLWGNLMAGGAGVEYYFGYQLPQNDLVAEDWRSRDQSWNYARIALEFFPANQIPFWEMKNADALVGNVAHDNSRYCLAKSGSAYLVYLPHGGTAQLDLTGAAGRFGVKWFNPRTGGALQDGSIPTVSGGGKVNVGLPPGEPAEDWLAIVRK